MMREEPMQAPPQQMPQNAPSDTPELEDVMGMAEEAGFDARRMVEEGDYEGLLQAAGQSPSAASDGGIQAIEMLSSRLGLGSQYGADYSKNEGPDYVFNGHGPHTRPNRRPGGIGSR
jgi:hypothetical protein